MIKALLASAFLFAAAPAAARCPLPADHQTARLERVIDGDTLALQGGRRLRLIGINTPESGYRDRPAQPLAEQASRVARELLGEAPIRLVTGQPQQDRHGRLLAHVFTNSGVSLEEALVARGLAFPVAIAPNLRLRDCLQQAAAAAEAAALGVWSHPYFQPRQVTDLGPGDGGYGRYRGRVSALGNNRSGPWLELDQTLYLPIARAATGLFDQAALRALKGQQVEVRGWLSPRRLSAAQRARNQRPWLLQLSHPDHLIPLAGQ